jgi:TatD DNase family protein
MKYIDIHAHLNFSDYDEDRQDVIERTLDNEMGVINIGTNIETSKEVLELAESHDNFYAIVGMHPADLDDTDLKLAKNEILEMIKHPKAIGIGECGLDFFRLPPEDIKDYKNKQRDFFSMQIELAIENDLPLMIHCRDAYPEVIEILNKYKTRTEDELDEYFGKRLRGDFHFFVGSVEDAKEILELGFNISFTGVITFAPQYRELVEMVPVDRIHAETDSPFVAPKEFRGKRNEPLYSINVIRKIAEIKNIHIEDLEKQLLINARNLFGVEI